MHRSFVLRRGLMSGVVIVTVLDRPSVSQDGRRMPGALHSHGEASPDGQEHGEQ